MNQEITFGQAVKERRELWGLTQAELGRRVGCAAITIRRIEADNLRSSVQIAEHLAVALGVPEAEYLAFVRLVRSHREPSPLPTPPPIPEEIGLEDLSGRAIRGYQLGERIGSGGYGVVYRAVQAAVNREVAVKIILPQYADRPEFIRRFEAEAQLVARLEHPHIVPLYDYWREPGVAYLVMRLLRGGSLALSIKNGPLLPETVLPWLEQICAGLHAAHQAGVIHRDIKPANILLDDAGNAYLADFGIAKITTNGTVGETLEGLVLGSPAYISPEQILVEPVKPQSDVYSLGVMLYELLAGHKAFDGPTAFALIQQHLNEPFPLLAACCPDLPPMLDRLIQRATAKDQAQRYPDVLSLLAEFRQAVAEEQGSRGAGAISPLLRRPPAPLLELTNPYKGLRSFSEADTADFFGREMLVQELLARLAEAIDPPTLPVAGRDLARFLAVVGPSGSGKSSVVRAGLIPALRQGGLPDSDQWFIIEMLPGAHPWEELEAALLRIAINPPESLLAQLLEDERGLLRAVQRILPADERIELVLLIDQFEELFTLTTDETSRNGFLNALVTAILDPRSRLRLVITLRADFTDRPLQYVDFGELLRHRTEFVLPLTPDELEQAIMGPAKRVGLTLAPGLVATISRDVGQEPGALPLLQYALTELFERREDHTLTKAAYHSSGGVLAALARRADELYHSLDAAGQAAARQLFLRLVTPGEGTEDTRRRVLRAEVEALTAEQTPSLTLPLAGGGDSSSPSPSEGEGRGGGPAVGGQPSAVIGQVIDQFGRYRLLSFDRDPVTRGPTIEVAHEALLREWGRLREWLDASRNDIRLQRLLATSAAEWREASQDASFLLRGTRLDQFASWAETTTLALTPDERTYLEVSLADRQARQTEEAARQQRELEAAQKLAETESRRATEQTRAARRLRWLAMGLALFLLVAIGAALLALQQTNRANQQTQLATSRELAAAALSNLKIDPERSVLLALQAVTTTYTVDKMVPSEAANALHQAVSASRIRLTLTGHTDYVWAVAFSPDGKYLATAGNDGLAKIWDATTGQQLLTLVDHTRPIAIVGYGFKGVMSVAFSPDGTHLATASADGSVKMWDIKVKTGEVRDTPQLTLAAHTSAAGVAFSLDGTRLVTWSWDKTAKVWNAAIGQELLTLTGHTAGIEAAVFSSDGTRLATASEDGTAKMWDAATGKELLTLSSHTGPVEGVAFSPDGILLATASQDKTAKVWDAATGKELLTLAGHAISVNKVVFSPDGLRLATTGSDGTAKIWDPTTGKELLTLAGHTDAVIGVAFSPDGSRLATASWDWTAKVWNVTSNGEWLDLPGSMGKFSPDGTRLATATGKTATIWDAATGQKLLTLAGHSELVFDVAFSPDGTRLATAGGDKTAKVWDAATGKELLTLAGHTDGIIFAFFKGVLCIAFSSDGSRLATAGADGTARIWDAATGQELLTLAAHDGGVLSVAFSPDGSRLVTAGWDNTAKIWDTTTGQELVTLSGHTIFVNDAIFSPDGLHVATIGGDNLIKIWDISPGATGDRALLTWQGHVGGAIWAAFSPDGTRLATIGGEGTVKIWDIAAWLKAGEASGQELLSLAGPITFGGSVAYSPDGTHLMASPSIWLSAEDGTHVFILPIEDLIALARTRVTRSLTLDECRQYLHVNECPVGR